MLVCMVDTMWSALSGSFSQAASLGMGNLRMAVAERSILPPTRSERAPPEYSSMDAISGSGILACLLLASGGSDFNQG